jgi:hypothetical protein
VSVFVRSVFHALSAVIVIMILQSAYVHEPSMAAHAVPFKAESFSLLRVADNAYERAVYDQRPQNGALAK